ncbi:hypothetical protein H2201_008699 [Coniosporium apollinis]|uniref:ARB-07466-like C-terminal domain-containing protein n=2 Tax=Coniosporium TaxID=2810619 RepID=A0ABQ9NJ26_9PEZI|nr:hypothetical protein H2199_003401 [Cladosporium sp. JES 115]KAJ9655926.1 hypothetical protein H2201_008699 [Coniosporium apollinis]
MQIQSLLHSVLLAATAVRAAVNEPCVGAGGAPGVCVSTSSCSSAGGTTINGACPMDPVHIKCCTKPRCGSSSAGNFDLGQQVMSLGNCRWSSDCAGSSVPDLCPGPADFKCCQSSAPGSGYAPPSFPSVDGCKRVAVDGARKIVAAFPGRVREIGCKRDCTCPGNSDHCCGKATDMMCSDRGGGATMSGQEIAEWVMNNRASLNLKYVIWGQRIWIRSGDSVKPWKSWSPMEDRHSITENHWDHVHVSYN